MNCSPEKTTAFKEAHEKLAQNTKLKIWTAYEYYESTSPKPQEN